MCNEWKKVHFNIQNIDYQTEKAYLLRMPHSSNYDGYKVWVNGKLVKNGTHAYERTLLMTSSFTFRIRKYDNRKVIDEKIIGADEMAEAFGGYAEAYSVETNVPAKLAPVETVADSSLLDD